MRTKIKKRVSVRFRVSIIDVSMLDCLKVDKINDNMPEMKIALCVVRKILFNYTILTTDNNPNIC